MFLFRWIGWFIGVLWRFLDRGRQIVFNLVFLVLIVALVMGLFEGGAPKLGDKTALILDLQGNLVEQQSGSVRETVLAQAQGDKKESTQLRDILLVLKSAAVDPKISSVVLLLDDMQGAGLPMLREVASAMERFKASGKPIVAWGSGYNQRQYFLAAHATEVYMHPMGVLSVEGFGRYRSYYRDALDKLGITVNLMRVGTYKSFAEPYIANGPSAAAAEAEGYLYNALWATYTSDVEHARKLAPGSIMRVINSLPALAEQTGGDLAKLALNAKFVDGLKTRDELRQMMLARGVRDDQSSSFRQIDFDAYLVRQKAVVTGDRVGVIVAEGDISDGNATSGSIGGLSTASLIRSAREDSQIKAVVLRVNSPGGSAFGAELIRRELELTRLAGKPVVVSMGNVAASGGYWISMGADEVIADAATVTGSIGVFALLPTADKAMEKIGVHSAGTTTTWLGGGYDPLRPIDPRFANLIQQSVNHVYADFTSRAALARKTTPEKINEVAQGRVWTGQQAKDRGLIDTVGSYQDALKSAADRAKLGKSFRVSYVEPEATGIDRVFKIFDVSAGKFVSQYVTRMVGERLSLVPAGLPPVAAREMAEDMAWLASMANRENSFGVVTHCLCREP